MNHIFPKLAFILLILTLFSNRCQAEADGPDYFQVVSSHSATLLAMDGEASTMISIIPPGTLYLKNLGCIGSPSYTEWEKMTPTERQQFQMSGRCKVMYEGQIGWVAKERIIEQSQFPASFDCDARDLNLNAIEKHLCQDISLKALDYMLSSVYQKSLKNADLPNQLNQLKAIQRGWLKGRNECWKQKNDISQCLTDLYLNRILHLQAQWHLIIFKQKQFHCPIDAGNITYKIFESSNKSAIRIEYNDNVEIYIQSDDNQDSYEGQFGKKLVLNDNGALWHYDQYQPAVQCQEVTKSQ